MMAPDAAKLQTHKEFYDAGSTPARRIEKDEFESLGATRLRSRASHLRSLNFCRNLFEGSCVCIYNYAEACQESCL